MAAITEQQLADRIEAAFDDEADQQVTVADARNRIAVKLASAINDFVVGRNTQVIGVQSGGSTAVGTIQ